MMHRDETDTAWAHRMVGQLPRRWETNLLNRWEQQRKRHGGDFVGEVEAQAAANRQLLKLSTSLEAVRIPLDASDATICTEADQLSARASELAQVMHTMDALRASLARIAVGYGVTPPGEKVEDGPAVARMADPIWWRRQLRKAHAKSVEGAAIELGYVNKSRDPYISNESVYRRAQQNERNAASLESTIATNEHGQEFTLAELAAKGPANKAIRRAELMTRIAGFERIARDMGHAGLFATVTCPSFMHKWRTVAGGRVMENPRYEGTLPNEAQKHLAKVWARTRAALARGGVYVYGFRIAEPNHDGTPHWHMLFFVESQHLDTLQATLKKYALQAGANEPGAQKHRVDFKTIDWARGSAAGYIAKYVSKNIDGYRLDKDLIGNDAVETSHRVEAWASTWGIRQFQQVGGPPVGPWRELRRVQAIPKGAPQHLLDAHNAVNKITDLEAGTVKSVAWDRYVKAQGGVFCGRDYLVRVALKEVEGLGKYGEPLPPKPMGVETTSTEFWTPAWMAHTGGQSQRMINWIVESARHVWTITRRKAGELVSKATAKPGPWTCVNNCTGGDDGTTRKTQNFNGKGHDRSGGTVGKGPHAYQSNGRGLCDPTFDGFGSDKRGTQTFA